MARVVGLFKELEGGEQLLYEPGGSMPAVLTTELEVKKLMRAERRAYPLVYSIVYPYLTSRRLLILALHQAESKLLLDHKAPRIPARSGAWLEVPVEAISLAELTSVNVRKDHDLAGFLSWAGLKEGLLEVAPAMKVVYDAKRSKGKVRDYVDLIVKLGVLIRGQRKVEAPSDTLLLLGEEAVSNLLPRLKELLEGSKEVGKVEGRVEATKAKEELKPMEEAPSFALFDREAPT
jgi:hypothetical protein